MALRSDNYSIQKYIEKAMIDLPAMPTVIVQVLQATEKDTVSTTEIENLISADAGIATKLLKVVNSAYFGLPRQVGYIGQAIAILGMHQVRNLVLSVGVLNALNTPSPKIIEVQRAFWENSFAAATTAQAMAKKKGLPTKDQDLCFIGGLLRDIGRLFLLTAFNQPYQQVLSEISKTNEHLIEAENKMLGTNHADLGGALAERWNFPHALTDVIKWHEDPQGCPEESLIPVLNVVNVADRLAAACTDGVSGTINQEWSPAVNEWLAFSDEEVEEMKEDLLNNVTRAKEFLGLI
ncbi:MAG: HDOD domain-containing protein [Armatimonadetes bacterium]|nr:HDOD domain-containing protein [Armatimonadota bacterium]